MIGGLAKFLGARGIDCDTFGAVFDIGSRDGRQALELANLFRGADIVAIECNRETLDICRRNVAQNSRIRLVDKAINSFTGRCPFYPIDPTRTITTWADGNPGASSLFVATGDYPIEEYVQNAVEVDCIRVDDLCAKLQIDVIDLIWMDLQGAELLALQSAGALLDKVRYIYTEVSHRPIYKGQCLFADVEAFLTARGFKRCTQIDRARWQQDAIYENTRDLIDVVIPLGPKSQDAVDLSVRSVRGFVGDVRHIYLVGAEDPNIGGARFVDERMFPFDIGAVRQVLGSHEPAGWYSRQLIRLYFPMVNRSCLEHVLAVDAFTMFLHPCRFIQDHRPIFNFGDEYHAPYFEHMARLCPNLHRMFAYSGIADCMLFKRAWLNELHREVEAHHARTPFWKAYLEAVDPADRDHGASDYEVYFNFCLMFHASDLILRRFRWSNVGKVDDIRPGRHDYVSLHHDTRQEPIDWRRLEQLVFAGLGGSE
ncbi:MAG: FkbM family methyltransferase [Acetobacteraceae bacterium]